MINIEDSDFDSDLLKIDKKSYKNIDIYYIGFITMKDFDYAKINSVNHLYLIIGEPDGYTEEKDGNKYLTLASTDKNKEVLKNYTEPCDRFKYQIKKNCFKPIEYEKDFMKIKFNSDDNLPLNQILENGKYYLQVFLDERLCEL